MSRLGGEGPVEKAVVEGAEARGGQALKLPANLYAGIPDRLVVLPNVPMFFCETKAPNGVVSPIQRRWHKLLALIGHRVEVPASVEAVEEMFYGRHA